MLPTFVQLSAAPLAIHGGLKGSTPISTPRLRGVGTPPSSPRAGAPAAPLSPGAPAAAAATTAVSAPGTGSELAAVAAVTAVGGALAARRRRRPTAPGGVGSSAVALRVSTLEKPEVETKTKTDGGDAEGEKANTAFSDEYYETASKIFKFIDANGNGSIDRAELSSALVMLKEEGNLQLGEDEDGFFFKYASGSLVEWEQAAREWFDKSLEDEVKRYWSEQSLERDHAFTRDEYDRFVDQVESMFKVGITSSDMGAGWDDLQKNYEKKKTILEFTNSVRSVFADRITEAVDQIFSEVDTEGKTNKLIDYSEIQQATLLLTERHGLDVSEEDTLLFMRIFGGIREEEWREGAAGLLNAGGDVGSVDLLSSFLKKDPELSDGTLSNGIPRQAAYGFQEWSRAQDQSRYIKSLLVLTSPASSLRRIGPPLFTIVSASVFIVVYNEFVAKSSGLPLLTLPTELFSLSAASLGLLLVFRTNGSYSRFDEARKIWGDTLNRCRDLTRQAAWISCDKDREDFFRYIPAFATALKCLLRPPDRHDLAQEASTHLKQREVREMLTSGLPPPCWVLYRMATIGDTIATDGQHQKHQLMSENISELIANVGKCERILSTPMPATYTRLSTRFLLVWLGLLPMMLYLKIGLSAVFATFVMAFFLLGIEDLGCQIEEPFSVLPLTRISNKIAAEASVVLNLKQKW
mmetsp:Transcript_147607/g.383806  ORF Transcript_147607/g.383806 Transcript_147607/m.383806 type:complete len:693 (+) Transcript_147607:119-2197(+)